MGRQDVGGVESVGTVELLVDSVQDLFYSFLFCLCVVGIFFFLFFGKEECLPPCKPLPLESSESLGVFLYNSGWVSSWILCSVDGCSGLVDVSGHEVSLVMGCNGRPPRYF